MAQIISASIDLSKIDKSKIKTTDKNGNPFANGAKYYDIVIYVNDEQNQYNQICSITQGQTKEEREAKADKVYLGNGKRVWASDSPAVPESHSSPAQANDDLPF